MDDKPSVEQLVSVFIKIRDARDAARREWEDKEADFNEQLDMIDQQLLAICKETGADSIKTGAGTIIRGVKTSYWTSDWESMHNFIKENQALDLLERRIAQRAMGEFLKANPDKMPKGMNVETKYSVTVRRA